MVRGEAEAPASVLLLAFEVDWDVASMFETVRRTQRQRVGESRYGPSRESRRRDTCRAPDRKSDTRRDHQSGTPSAPRTVHRRPIEPREWPPPVYSSVDHRSEIAPRR